MKKYLPVLAACLLLLIFKASYLSIRLSDTNIYWYTAYVITTGKLLYRDIFFTNLPLFPYISVFYYFLVGKQLLLYFLTPTIEVSIVALLIFHIIFKQTKQVLISTLCSLSYLFSFIVLSTSDHQTGVFIASLFAVLAYVFFEKKSYKIAGSFVALSLLTKAYFLPVFLTFFITLFWQRQYKQLFWFTCFFLLVCFIILLPFIILTPQGLFHDVIGYSLTRGAGVSKINILWFFVTHELLFFILLFFNLINFRKHIFFASISFFGILFFIFYRDIYYLYLNSLIPFLALSLTPFIYFVQKQFPLQKMVIPTIIFLSLIWNGITYQPYTQLGAITSFDQILQMVQKEKTSYIYGTNDIAPMLAYMTNKKLVNNTVDTNANIFRKGYLNAETVTADAIKQHAIIVGHGAQYPQQGIHEDLLDEIFDKKQIKRQCIKVYSTLVITEGVDNTITIFRCG